MALLTKHLALSQGFSGEDHAGPNPGWCGFFSLNLICKKHLITRQVGISLFGDRVDGIVLSSGTQLKGDCVTSRHDGQLGDWKMVHLQTGNVDSTILVMQVSPAMHSPTLSAVRWSRQRLKRQLFPGLGQDQTRTSRLPRQ